MRQNPIYPKDWEVPFFRKGDRVTIDQPGHPLNFETGVIVSWNEKKGTFDIRMDRGGTITIHRSFLGKNRYHSNPVYPEQWNDDEFIVGDHVEIRPDIHNIASVNDSVHPGSRGVVSGYMPKDTWNNCYWVDLDARGGGTAGKFIIPGAGMKKIKDSFAENPVYPKEWESGPRFKIGDRLLVVRDITNKMHAGYIGKVLSVREGVIPRRSWMYLINHHANDEWVEEKDLRLNSHFGHNPVYPKEWLPFKKWKFEIGDKVVCTEHLKDKWFINKTGEVCEQRFSELQSTGKTTQSFLIEFQGGRMSWVRAAHLDLVERYSDNPVYPEQWRIDEPTNFSKGNVVRIKDGRGVFSNRIGIIVRVQQPIFTTPLMFKVWFKNEAFGQEAWIYPQDMELLSDNAEGYSFNNNPVFPIEWGNTSPYAVGNYVEIFNDGSMLPRDQWTPDMGYLVSLVGKRGIIRRIYKIASKTGYERYRYDVMLDGEVETTSVPHRNLKKIAYNENPVYPEEWSDQYEFKAGDIVQHRINGNKGVVLYPNVPYGGVMWLKVRWHFNPFSQFGGERLVPPTSVKKIGSYNENPVYPEEWHQKPKFQTGDRFKVVSRSDYRGRYGTVLKVIERVGTESEDKYATVLDEDVRHFDNTPTYFYERSIEKTDVKFDKAKYGKRSWQHNPVYPEEWAETKFKVGQYVRITNPGFSNAGYKGHLARIESIHFLVKNWKGQDLPTYGCIAVSKRGKSLVPSYGYWLHDEEMSLAEAGIPNEN